jgi:hypothetical protein
MLSLRHEVGVIFNLTHSSLHARLYPSHFYEEVCMHCAVGQFAVAKQDEERIPLFVHRYVSGRGDEVEVLVTRRKEVARVRLGTLIPIPHNSVTSGLIGFEAIHANYGKGVIWKEEPRSGLLHVYILRQEGGPDSGPVPINEIALGPPTQKR